MTEVIRIDGLSKTFRTGSPFPILGPRARTVSALEDVSLTVHPGEIYGLVGRNGYGKTTLIKCVASLIQPTRGTVRVLGHDSVSGAREVRRVVGLVAADERSFYWRLTGRQNLTFFAQLHGLRGNLAHQRIEALAERFEVQDLLDRRFQEYSTGNRQRLALVRALLHEPPLLVLDEPTRSLDPFSAARLRQSLTEWVCRGERRSVLITSHNLAEVEALSHRVGIMSRGKLCEQGAVDELRRKYDSQESITLFVDRPASDQVLAHLRAKCIDARLDPDPESGFALRFRATKGDGRLDAVLRVLVQEGVGITSFDRVQLSLQDIVDRVESESMIHG